MSEPLVKNTADEGQVKEAEAKVKRGRERELADLLFILSTVQGRRLIWRYLSRCGIFKTSFVEDSNRTAYNEGERMIGLNLLADVMEADPDSYLKMMKEAKEVSNA